MLFLLTVDSFCLRVSYLLPLSLCSRVCARRRSCMCVHGMTRKFSLRSRKSSKYGASTTKGFWSSETDLFNKCSINGTDSRWARCRLQMSLGRTMTPCVPNINYGILVSHAAGVCITVLISEIGKDDDEAKMMKRKVKGTSSPVCW